jgi:hypothetical protein
MDKLPFYNDITGYAVLGKKGNMMYWDAIDDLCEKFTLELLDFSVPKLDIDEDDVLYWKNEIRDFAVQFLESHSDARFPFVDENY